MALASGTKASVVSNAMQHNQQYSIQKKCGVTLLRLSARGWDHRPDGNHGNHVEGHDGWMSSTSHGGNLVDLDLGDSQGVNEEVQVTM